MNLFYPKIYGPFRRFTEGPKKNQLDREQWYTPEFEALATIPWQWTEKVDGTNIRVIWDGHRVTIGGRTAAAQLNWELLDYLKVTFPEELMEQQFGEVEATLFGEGFGPGINRGGVYGETKSFALFDVAVADAEHPLGYWWLSHETVRDVAGSLGCSVVPFVGTFSVVDAIHVVEDGVLSGYGAFVAEGIVGRPLGGFLNRRTGRIIIKIKGEDFPG